MAENKKFQSDIVIEKNVNHKLEEKILKKKKRKKTAASERGTIKSQK